LFVYLLKVFGNFYGSFVVGKIASPCLHQPYCRIVELFGVFESVLKAKFDTGQVGNRISFEIDLLVVRAL